MSIEIYFFIDIKELFLIYLMLALVPSSINCISEDFIATNNVLSIKLFQDLMSRQTGNFIYGIYPLDSIIASTFFGTRGRTAKEIKSAIGSNISNEQITNNFISARAELADIIYYYLHLTNWIYVDKRLDINPLFVEKASSFGTNVVERDLSERKKTIDNNNSIAEDHIGNKIKNLIYEKQCKPRTDLVLETRMNIHGKRLKGFEKMSTEKMDFFLSKKKKVVVNMMKVTGYFMVFIHPTLAIKMIKIPFENEKVYMIIMIADDKENVNCIGETAFPLWNVRNFTLQYFTLYMPKFQVTSSINMIPTLKDLGIIRLFSLADLSGVSKQATNVSAVIQEVSLDVDEDGVSRGDSPESDNQNMEEIGPNKQAEVFKVDRPFVFGILYRNDFSLVFGRINVISD